MSTALKLLPKEQQDTGRNTREKVENTYTEELFISICSPIGSLKEEAVVKLAELLRDQYQYQVTTIKLSDFIEKYTKGKFLPLSGKTEIFSKYFFKINGGNDLRQKYNNQILAELAISDIHSDRAETVGDKHLEDTEYKTRRHCYIIDSLKNTEELKLLRSVYTDNFYQISIFSPLEQRIENLISKGFSQPEADEIIKKDEYQNIDSGQNVRGTFVESDFFLRSSKENAELIETKLKRYLHLIFETQIITPTTEETAMFYAKSAASNSSCLSRQVGASITDSNGVILSTGWNDVPKFGGNLYKDDSINDSRCFTLGYCTNSYEKTKLAANIADILLEYPEINQAFSNQENNDNRHELEELIKKSKIKDLIEFSRSVHAEMHAIVIGSQITGTQMINGKLFCTTYPCHNCARHIVLSGIKEVYYIEPYVKSLCLTLHEDSMTEAEEDTSKVKILIFDGVSPRKYQIFFTNFAERKDSNGKLNKLDLENAKPKSRKSLQALPALERQAILSLKEYGILDV